MPTDQPTTAALRDWPCTNADHHGLCSDRHIHSDHVVAALTSCPTSGVCPTCREGWGHYTAGHGYAPTIESERARRAQVPRETVTVPLDHEAR